MHQSRVLPVLKNAQIPQTQLSKALVNKVDGRVDVKRDRGLVGSVRYNRG